MNVEDFKSTDPFAEAQATDTGVEDIEDQKKFVHLRVQQRNGRKTLTTVTGMPKEYDLKKLLKAFKKEFACNGTLVEDKDGKDGKDGKVGTVIQLQGDQRVKIQSFLLEDGIPKSLVKLHGF